MNGLGGLNKSPHGVVIGLVQLKLEPVDAFGDYDEELLRVEPRGQFPETLEIGMQFEGIPGEEADAEETVN